MNTSLSLLSLCVLSACIACGSDETQPSKDTPQQNNTNVSEDMANSGLTDLAMPDMAMINPIDMTRGVDEGVDMQEEADMALPPIMIPDKPWNPTQRGPYNVGFDRRTFTYTAKPDGEVRKITYVFWYPTTDAQGFPARYIRKTLKQKDGVLFLASVAPPLEGEDTKRPFLIFSHGNSSFAEQNKYMTEYLASHGWITVAPDHQGNTLFDAGGGINFDSAIPRPQDIKELLNVLESMPNEHPLYDKLDFDKIGMSGHSFGGYTTLAMIGTEMKIDELKEKCDNNQVRRRGMCKLFTPEIESYVRPDPFYDPRIKTAIAQTPASGLFFGDGTSQIKVPTLMMTASRDKTLPEAEDGDVLWAGMQGPHARFTLPQGGHFTYTNMCEVTGDSVAETRDDGCGKDFTPAEDAHPLINHYVLAWLEYHLKNNLDFEPLVKGTNKPYPETTVTYEQAPSDL